MGANDTSLKFCRFIDTFIYSLLDRLKIYFIHLLERYGKACWYHESHSNYLEKNFARSCKSEIEDDFTRHIREIRLSPQTNYILITIHS